MEPIATPAPGPLLVISIMLVAGFLGMMCCFMLDHLSKKLVRATDTMDKIFLGGCCLILFIAVGVFAGLAVMAPLSYFNHITG